MSVRELITHDEDVRSAIKALTVVCVSTATVGIVILLAAALYLGLVGGR